VDAKSRFKVGSLVKIVLKAFAKRVTVGPDKIRLHFRLADHAIPAKYKVIRISEKNVIVRLATMSKTLT